MNESGLLDAGRIACRRIFVPWELAKSLRENEQSGEYTVLRSDIQRLLASRTWAKRRNMRTEGETEEFVKAWRRQDTVCRSDVSHKQGRAVLSESSHESFASSLARDGAGARRAGARRAGGGRVHGR